MDANYIQSLCVWGVTLAGLIVVVGSAIGFVSFVIFRKSEQYRDARMRGEPPPQALQPQQLSRIGELSEDECPCGEHLGPAERAIVDNDVAMYQRRCPRCGRLQLVAKSG